VGIPSSVEAGLEVKVAPEEDTIVGLVGNHLAVQDNQVEHSWRSQA